MALKFSLMTSTLTSSSNQLAKTIRQMLRAGRGALQGWTTVLRPSQLLKVSNSGSFLFTMPAIPQRKSTFTSKQYERFREGPTKKVQMPQLPKQLEGKYVRGQMYKYQDTLPKLPVPPLEQTLTKYIRGIKALVSNEEFERTKEIVAEFGKPGGVGEQLQRELMERAESTDSWLIEWWNTVAYLGFREPVVVHSNPAVGFPPQAHGDKETYTKMVARFILGLMKFSTIIQNHAIPPDLYRKRALCMAQYDFYSKCRVPAETVDISRQTEVERSKHVIVVRNGHFFKLDVLYECPDGTLALAPPSHIVKELQAIMDSAPDMCEHPVGILTTEHRDSWYRTRQELLKDPINQSTLEAIETAQGTFCLDKSFPGEAGRNGTKFKYWDPHKTMLANRYLHGNGSQQHSCNRWFDSAIQLMFGEDGGVGSNLEHSAADGVAAISVDLFALNLQDMYDVLTDTSPVPAHSLHSFQPLTWNISLSVARDIQVAKEKLDKLAADVDLNVFTFTDFGKNLPKSFKLSPDGFIQNAIILTYYRMYGCMTPMYESGGTRMFRLGRTDTIRNTTSEAHEFVKTMQDTSASDAAKAAALVAAVKAHSNATVEAIEGQAFDRHLLGLRMIAKEKGIEMPAIFTDPAYGKTLHFRLSTSQVPVPNHEVFLCFGAVVPDGYGVCYNPQEQQIILSVSCFRNCPDTDSILFLKNMVENLSEMRDVLLSSQPPSAKL